MIRLNGRDIKGADEKVILETEIDATADTVAAQVVEQYLAPRRKQAFEQASKCYMDVLGTGTEEERGQLPAFTDGSDPARVNAMIVWCVGQAGWRNARERDIDEKVAVLDKELVTATQHQANQQANFDAIARNPEDQRGDEATAELQEAKADVDRIGAEIAALRA